METQQFAPKSRPSPLRKIQLPPNISLPWPRGTWPHFPKELSAAHEAVRGAGSEEGLGGGLALLEGDCRSDENDLSNQPLTVTQTLKNI